MTRPEKCEREKRPRDGARDRQAHGARAGARQPRDLFQQQQELLAPDLVSCEAVLTCVRVLTVSEVLT